ncbi:hypothetical protein ACN47E_000853 [Coniothyrium glycines]
MAGLERPEPAVATTRALKRKHMAADHQHDLDDLDGVFKRIKAKVPRTPYILSTPSLDPYRYHSQQEANAWTMGRLWRHDEEHIQYRTFLYREPCQDCFELQAGEDDDPEPDQPAPSTSTAARGPPPVKKKVNLSTFRVKQATGALVPGAKTSSPTLAPTKHGPDLPNGTGTGTKSAKQHGSTDKAGARSPKQSAASQEHDAKPKHAAHEPTNAPARQRAPSQASDHGKPIGGGNSETSNGTPHGLPPLLSPVHEPIGNPYGLPNILSPTLPANVQAELDRLEKRQRADSNTSTSSSDRKNQTLAVPATATHKSEDTPRPGVRIRSVSLNGKSPLAESIGHPADLDSSLVVKLKFSKTKAPTVKQILRLPPKRPSVEKKERSDPVKQAVKADLPKIEGPVIKKKAIPKVAARRGETSTPTPVAEKRPRPDDDASMGMPSKRPRALSTQDRPVTPAPPVTSSPAPPGKTIAQKSQPPYTTPKKGTKAVSMLRTASTESNDTTPGRSGGTPASSKLDQKTGPTSAPLNNKKSADISLLAQTSIKLNQMGRALKHEATKILTMPSNRITKQDEKRAAVTNLECILSYMAAYYAQDYSLNLRGRAGEVEQTWKTLLPLCLSYARCTKDFQHLDGLRSYLSSIIASAICSHVSQRGSSARAHDSPQDFATAEATKQHNNVAENFALLADHTLKMNRHFQDARIALPLDDLQSTYKKTFAARETNLRLLKEPEKISGSRMTGAFFLPLSTDTSPIQAVRFGLKFLAEYCEKEKLDYTFRISLEKPE